MDLDDILSGTGQSPDLFDSASESEADDEGIYDGQESQALSRPKKRETKTDMSQVKELLKDLVNKLEPKTPPVKRVKKGLFK